MKKVVESKRSGLAVWTTGCLLIACAILAPAMAFAQNPVYGWAKRMGGTGADSGQSVARDSSGNIYVTGSFSGTVDFAADFGGSDVKTSAGSGDIFVTRINRNGTYGWTKSMGGAGSDAGNAVSVDSSGNVYVTGRFMDTVNFAADWLESESKTSAGNFDIFVTRINANGDYGWTRRMGGTEDDFGQGVAVDPNGNVYVTGSSGYSFGGPVAVNFAADWSGSDSKNTWGYDIFVTRINANGGYGWTRMMGGMGDDQGLGVAVDSSGNVYVTGTFYSAVNFAADWWGSDTKIASYYDIFVTRINANGSYGWTKRMGGTDTDMGRGVSVDSSGNVYVAGVFYSTTVNFAEDWSGSDSKTLAGVSDVFVTRINANGSYGWTKRMGGTGDDSGYGVSLDSSGNVYVTGYFADTVNFAADWAGSDIKTSAGLYDIFVIRINADGAYGWTKRMGGTGDESGSGVSVDSNGNVYVTGYFLGAENFAEDFGGSDVKTSAGTADIFLAKIDPPPVYGWAKSAGGTGNDAGNGVSRDSSGNVYTTGYFNGTVNFAADFGGSDVKTAAGSADIFITRINRNGTYGWTKRMGGTGLDIGYGVFVDSTGNVYVTGRFAGTVNFAADWSGTDSKTPAGGDDIFVTRINADGTYGWTKRMGGTGQDIGYGVFVDSSGSVYLTGIFNSAVNFAADWSLTDSKTPAGGYDIFVTRINKDGAYGWTKRLGGTGDDQGLGVAVDSSGNVYVTGTFYSTANFAADWSGTDSKTASYYDIFVTRINANGSYGWTKRMGGTGSDMGRGVSVDSNGNVYVAGVFYSPTVNFAADWSGSDPKTLAGVSDIFVTRINANGAYGWTRRMGGTGDDAGNGVAVDSSGNVYVTGSFTGTVNFAADWSGSDAKTYAGGWDDVFITRINADGAYGWTKRMGGTGDESGSGVSVDSSENVYVTGQFAGTVNFAADFGGSDLKTSAGAVDIFLAKINAPDADKDGLPDLLENQSSCPNRTNPDSDGDGLCDGNLTVAGVCMAGEDMNYNGVVDAGETSPCDDDMDDDGLNDGFEVLVSRSNPFIADTDGDGLNDIEEVLLYGTDPNVADMDGDGLTDFQEVITYQTDPWLIDSDGDGLSDFSEVIVTGNNPLDPDSDHDGIPDGLETGSTLTDRDGDAMPTAWEKTFGCLDAATADASIDADSDGLNNLAEYNAGTDPCAADTDGDGLSDSAEITAGTDPTVSDTDGDGLADGAETITDPLLADTDSDGWSDGAEVAAGSDPTSPASVPDASGPEQLINYQGRLMDNAGLPVNGTVPMAFGIYGVAAGGTPLWTEAQTVTVTQGIYNVLLGSVNPIDPAVFPAAQTTRFFLQVTVNGQALMPRSQIAASLMSMFAGRLYEGRLEMETHGLDVPVPAAAVTVHVSFRQAFMDPPRVVVSPLAGTIGGKKFIPTLVSNITATGFDVTFDSLTGQAASGSSSFTYQAMGN